MGFISSLKRTEKGGLTVPSFPALVTKTGSPPTGGIRHVIASRTFFTLMFGDTIATMRKNCAYWR
jgi:hypothetical protein